MPRRLLLALTALFSLALAGPALAAPPDAELTAVGLSPAAVRSMSDPVVVDRAGLQVQLDALTNDLATFERMLDLVRDRRERKALGDQLAAIGDRLAVLRTELRAGAPARFDRPDRRSDRRADRRRDRDRRDRHDRRRHDDEMHAATGAQLAALSESLRQASFRKDKMRVLRLAVPQHYFSTAQVKQIVEHFSFSSDKVEVLALLHPRLTDPENTHTLFALLPHASDRRKLEERITGTPAP